MQIELVTGSRKPYRQLLLLGDEDLLMLARYAAQGQLFGGLQGQEPVAVALVVTQGSTCELKNLAVATPWQHQGLGFAMVNHVLDYYRGAYARLVVGTGDADFANLRFYRRLGFRFCGVRRDFFDAYEPPVVVDGLRMHDMVMLDHSLG
ncbi:GNAT family N-acetyltransferase [Lacticaseibacillus suihuaensis]